MKTRISFGQHKSFNRVLFQETFAAGSVSLPISVNITEEDPVFHDTGSGSSRFNVQLQESEPQTHSFNANNRKLEVTNHGNETKHSKR